MDRGAVEHRRRAAHQSQVLVGRDRLQRGEVSGNMGGIPRCGQQAQGTEPPDGAVARPYLRRPGCLLVPLSLSWGGKELETDGKTVALNSKETVESVKF